MNFAIIDLGTNTFNLLIANVEGSGYRKVFGTKEVVKLGEGGITKNFIDAPAFKRGIDALLKHRETIGKYEALKIFAFATSALRDAGNSGDFIKAAFDCTGIKINVISGEKEAEYIYYGVRQAVALGEKPCLVMDIGGGSTEFILGNSEKIFWKKSFQLGVSRLLEKLKPADPVSDSDIEILNELLKKELQPLFAAIQDFPVDKLVGSSGSFDSFAEMIVCRFYTKDMLKGKTGYEFNLEELAEIHDMVIKSVLSERLKMAGLVPFRADNIVLSGLLIKFILDKLAIRTVHLSKYSLKEGVLWAILNEII